VKREREGEKWGEKEKEKRFLEDIIHNKLRAQRKT
jgi:hypothetical protein